jgi:hypothetical protein
VITGRNDIQGEGDLLRGDKQDRSILFTQVWVRRAGRWFREAFQATFVAEH